MMYAVLQSVYVNTRNKDKKKIAEHKFARPALMTWKERYEKDSSLTIQSLQETSGSAVCQDGNGSGGSLLQQTGLRHAETGAGLRIVTKVVGAVSACRWACRRALSDEQAACMARAIFVYRALSGILQVTRRPIKSEVR